MRALDLTGQTFGRLTVVEISGRRARGLKEWRCSCSCGGTIVVPTDRLRAGKTKSCGCLRGENFATHGKYHAPEHNSWSNMIQRCTNPRNRKFYAYGARGITVCDRWLTSFENFLTDMGSRPGPEYSIERVENDKGYEKANCKWATRTEQQRNTRRNRTLTYRGETKCRAQWAQERGLSPEALRSRLRKGWSVERALTTPSR